MASMINNEQLEAFLIEAELVSQKIKALASDKMSPEQFDRLQRLRVQDKQRKQDYKLRKQQQQEQRKRKGIEGKGIGKDFQNFCRACHLEYVYETPKCLKCERPTMTVEQRQKQLGEMVEDYKAKKNKKEERKQKWEMWKKTKAMLWKKTSTAYTKWDVYTESEDEEKEETQPILPKNDPNFKALEMDMQERSKKRAEDTKRANNLKEKGNKAMSEGDYEKATQFYTFALDYIKDNKSIYTNRALAYIKLKKYNKAIKDCNSVIDYIECFEKIEECPDLAFKAFSRKALAHKERKQYREALQAIDSALKIFPKDESAHKLKKQIENFQKFVETTEKVLKKQQEQNKKQEENKETQIKSQGAGAVEANDESKENTQEINQKKEYSQEDIIKQLAQKSIAQQNKSKPAQKIKQPVSTTTQQQFNRDPVASIKKTVNSPTAETLELLLNLLIKQPEYKNIFISCGGIKKLLEYFISAEQSTNAPLIICFTMDNTGVAEKDVWEFGVNKIEQKIKTLLSGELKVDEYSKLIDLFQIMLSLSLTQKYRVLLASNKQTVDFIMHCYPILISKFKKQPQLLSSFIIYVSNLCISESVLKNELNNKLPTVLASLQRIIETQSKNKRLLELQKGVFNLISNLLTKEIIRDNFYTQNEMIALLVQRLKSLPRHNDNFRQSIVALLSLFANMTFQPKPEILKVLQDLKLHEIIYSRFVIGDYDKGQTLLRSLQILSKLSYQGLKIEKAWIKTFDRYFDQQSIKQGLTNHALRFYNNIYVSNPGTDLPKLQNISKLILLDDNDILFCNTCTLFGVLADNPTYSKQAQAELQKYIKRLVDVAKDKTGNMRKSSGILLAKIAKDESNRAIFTEHHGMQVLKSIAHIILQK